MRNLFIGLVFGLLVVAGGFWWWMSGIKEVKTEQEKVNLITEKSSKYTNSEVVKLDASFDTEDTKVNESPLFTGSVEMI